MRRIILLSASAVALASASAMAQTEQPPVVQAPSGSDTVTVTTTETATAGADSQCLQQLQDLASRMDDEGYWLSGWNNMGQPATTGGAGLAADPSALPADGAGAVGAPARDPATGQPMATTGVPPAETGDVGYGTVATPWGEVDWTTRPRFAIGTLFDAAVVLGQRGDEDACNTVLASIDGIYSDYRAQMDELGVRPEEISTWRQEQIVLATPVSEYQGDIRIDDIVDSDVRNPADENLGDIEDVVVDPRSGNVRYVIVEHGGLFGIGADRYVVPWNQLRVTAGMNTFVLPVSEDVIENAPRLERGRNVGSDFLTEAERFWETEVERAVQ